MDILIIKPKWAELILSGQKIWEIRGSNTKKRGIIGIAESGTGKVFGEAELVYSALLDLKNFLIGQKWHKLEISWVELWTKYKTPYFWEFCNAKRYEEPRPYNHPKGAVIWVKE